MLGEGVKTCDVIRHSACDTSRQPPEVSVQGPWKERELKTVMQTALLGRLMRQGPECKHQPKLLQSLCPRLSWAGVKAEASVRRRIPSLP